MVVLNVTQSSHLIQMNFKFILILVLYDELKSDEFNAESADLGQI